MTERADVLVIGAGASGSLAAWRLSESGLKVVCLEQGDWVDPSAFPGDKPEWEIVAQKQWNANPNIRQRPEDYPCQTSDSDINPLMFSAVGGGTIIYVAHWCRQLPSDFRTRTLDGVGDDWPFTYEDLQPFYDDVEKEIGVAGLGGDPAYPPGAAPPQPPHSIRRIGRTAAQGMNKLGWHWWPAANAISTSAYRNLQPCVRYGTCRTGCPARAKASFDLVFWPRALHNGVRLITGARVREITVNEAGLATGAIYVDRSGTENHQRADVVVLAANGIGTPRLLLLSTSKHHPTGLSNSSGLVGKRLMMHPYGSVIGIYGEDLESWVGPTGQLIQSMHFYETDHSRGFVRGGKWNVMPTGGPLSIGARYGTGARSEWGPTHHRQMREEFGHAFEWGVVAEDLPEDSNFVSLDPDLQDSNGIPAPRIRYEYSQNTRRLMSFHLQRMQEAHDAAGAVRTIARPFIGNSGHLMGTARMGLDPRTSVVDEYGRCHDVSNLYVVDSSVFPTGSGVNPTATLCAVALRSLEHMIRMARQQVVPA